MSESALQIIDHTVVVGSFQCNCRILACPRSGEAVLIDPGDEPEEILRTLQGLKVASGASLSVKYLFHTHAHLDHIGGTRKVREKLTEGESSPQIALHRADEPLYLQLKMQGRLFGLEYSDPLPIDHFFEDSEVLRVGVLKFSIIHTPGHSPGSICLRLHEDQAFGIRESLFSGDTLFQGSVGRTDLWGGDSDQLFKSIRQRIFTLDEDTRVCPGLGLKNERTHFLNKIFSLSLLHLAK